MILYAAYIITIDGREILSEIFQSPENVPNQSILSGLLSAFSYMSQDLTQQEGAAEKLSLSGLIYHIRNYGDFMVVIVTDADNAPSKILDSIGWRFLQDYGEELDSWRGNQTIFEDFRGIIDDIVHKYIDESRSVDPSKKLDTASIYHLPKEIQATALAITTLETASIAEVAEEVQIDPTIVGEYLQTLHKDGYIGVRQKDEGLVYFC
ncbi:MAG: hypothetical protein ACXAD7_22700 [Candidatus Kariarchaeaceae archaeon]|jgi:hypothetical protein